MSFSPTPSPLQDRSAFLGSAEAIISDALVHYIAAQQQLGDPQAEANADAATLILLMHELDFDSTVDISQLE